MAKDNTEIKAKRTAMAKMVSGNVLVYKYRQQWSQKGQGQ